MRHIVLYFIIFVIGGIIYSHDSVMRSNGSDSSKETMNWLSYKEGIKEMKKTNKKGLLVFHSNHCPTCRVYEKILQSEIIQNELNDLVLIKVNTNTYPELNEQYNFDGKYTPRTFALYSNGSIVHSLYGESLSPYKYFIPVDNESYLLNFLHKLNP